MSKIEFKGDFEDCELVKGGSQQNVILKVRNKDFKLYDKLKEMNNEKGLRITIEKWREKRSLDANSYAWYLQNEIAKVLNAPLDEIHKKMVLNYGVIEFYSILKQAVESAVRVFDYYEIKGEGVVNGKTFVHIKTGIGTHKYDTAEMSRFIDGVVQEAKELGIETRTLDEIANLKSLWGKE